MPRVEVVEADKVRQQFEATVYRVGGGLAKRTFSMAMNKIGRTTNAEIKRALVAQTSIKKREVDAGVKPFNASPGRLQFKITASGRHYPLRYFKHNETSVGVNAVVWGQLESFPSTFIVPLYSGGIYRRLSERRFPIKQLWGPALPVELLKDESIATWERNIPRIGAEATRLLGLMLSGTMR